MTAAAAPGMAPPPRRGLSLRAMGVLAVLAVVALATVMVASALLFRGAVQSHLQSLEQVQSRQWNLQQQRADLLRSGADAARLEDLELQLRDAAAQRDEHLATTRHYVDGSTVTIAALAWLGITSIAALCLLFFSQAVEELAEALARRERELAVERRHVMHQEKLATIGSMAAGVIREIGNPIAAIDGYARALLEPQGAAAEAANDGSQVRPILQETARLIAITREISGLAAAPAAQWQLASLNEIVHHTLGLLRYEPRLQDVKLTTELDAQLPAVMGYEDRLVQMLSNLVINAADATSDLPAHTRQVTIGTRRAGGGVELQVADNGCGLSDTVIARAFEPLFTTKPAGQGTGLGLPLCRSIVEGHGGRIRLERRPEGGARATVWLPLEGAEPYTRSA